MSFNVSLDSRVTNFANHWTKKSIVSTVPSGKTKVLPQWGR